MRLLPVRTLALSLAFASTGCFTLPGLASVPNSEGPSADAQDLTPGPDSSSGGGDAGMHSGGGTFAGAVRPSADSAAHTLTPTRRSQYQTGFLAEGFWPARRNPLAIGS